MSKHSELLKEVRERADALESGALAAQARCEVGALLLRTLAEIVEVQDKAPTLTENLAAFRRDLDALDRRVGQQAMMNTCVLCGNDNARAWEWLKRGPPGELSSSCTRMVCSHCVTVMKLGRPPIHPAAGGGEPSTAINIAEVFDEAVAACRVCSEAINTFAGIFIDGIHPDRPIPIVKRQEWIKLRAAGHLAKQAADLADELKAKGGPRNPRQDGQETKGRET